MVNVYENEYFMAVRFSSARESVRWHGFNLKPWHVAILAKRAPLTHRGLTLVGIVTSVSIGTYTFFRSVNGGGFRGETYGKTSDTVPENGIFTSFRREKDFLDCIDIAVSSLDVASGMTKFWRNE